TLLELIKPIGVAFQRLPVTRLPQRGQIVQLLIELDDGGFLLVALMKKGIDVVTQPSELLGVLTDGLQLGALPGGVIALRLRGGPKRRDGEQCERQEKATSARHRAS